MHGGSQIHFSAHDWSLSYSKIISSQTSVDVLGGKLVAFWHVLCIHKDNGPCVPASKEGHVRDLWAAWGIKCSLLVYFWPVRVRVRGQVEPFWKVKFFSLLHEHLYSVFPYCLLHNLVVWCLKHKWPCAVLCFLWVDLVYFHCTSRKNSEQKLHAVKVRVRGTKTEAKISCGSAFLQHLSPCFCKL